MKGKNFKQSVIEPVDKEFKFWNAIFFLFIMFFLLGVSYIYGYGIIVNFFKDFGSNRFLAILLTTICFFIFQTLLIFALKYTYNVNRGSGYSFLKYLSQAIIGITIFVPLLENIDYNKHFNVFTSNNSASEEISFIERDFYKEDKKISQEIGNGNNHFFKRVDTIVIKDKEIEEIDKNKSLEEFVEEIKEVDKKLGSKNLKKKEKDELINKKIDLNVSKNIKMILSSKENHDGGFLVINKESGIENKLREINFFLLMAFTPLSILLPIAKNENISKESDKNGKNKQRNRNRYRNRHRVVRK